MSTDDKLHANVSSREQDVGSRPVAEHESPPPSTPVDAEAERRLIRKQDVRIIPLSAATYLLCFLDRANIGNARVLNSSTGDDMQRSTGMSDGQFIVALVVFIIAYGLFEVPSNMLLKKLRPSRWLASLMFCWGAATMALGGTRDFAGVAAARFLLGVFEAGLFPGLIYLLTFWYRHDERSIRVAFILSSATLAGAFGGAIAYGIGHINGAAGLAGWRWLFIIEGLPSCVSSLLVLVLFPDYPESAGWLSAQEKDLARRRLLHEGSKGSDPGIRWHDVRSTLTEGRLCAHYAMYFALGPAFASLSLFAPSITAGLGYRDLEAQLMTVPPWAVAYVCQMDVAYSADRFNARGAHAAGAAVVGAAGFAASAALPAGAYAARYGGLVAATAGVFACVPPLLGWLTSNVAGTASTGLAIAINVSIGAGLGQLPGLWIYRPGEAARGYPTGHGTNAGFMLAAAALALGLRAFYVRTNGRLAAEAARRGAAARLYKL